MSTTPQVALEAMLDLPRLEDVIKTEAMSAAYRTRRYITEQQTRSAKHTYALADLQSLNNILCADEDWVALTYTFDKLYEIQIPNQNTWETKNIRVNYHSNVYFA